MQRDRERVTCIISNCIHICLIFEFFRFENLSLLNSLKMLSKSLLVRQKSISFEINNRWHCLFEKHSLCCFHNVASSCNCSYIPSVCQKPLETARVSKQIVVFTTFDLCDPVSSCPANECFAMRRIKQIRIHISHHQPLSLKTKECML